MMGVKITIDPKNNPLAKMKDPNQWNKFVNKLFSKVKQEIHADIQMQAQQSLKKTSGKYMTDVHSKLEAGKKLMFWSDHPAAMALEYGFDEERPMTWLVKPYNIGGLKFENGPFSRKVVESVIGQPKTNDEFPNKTGKRWTYPKREGLFIFKNAFRKAVKTIQANLRRGFIVQLVED